MKTKPTLILLLLQSFFTLFAFAGDDCVFSAITNALMNSDNVALRAALENGENPNDQGNDYLLPLTSAIKAENADAIDILLEFHADPCTPDRNGKSPIIHAITEYQPNYVIIGKLLQATHKNHNHETYNVKHQELMFQTVRAFADKKSIPEPIMNLYSENYVNHNPVNKDGKTPLDIAYDLCYPPTQIQFLKQKGMYHGYQYRQNLPQNNNCGIYQHPHGDL